MIVKFIASKNIQVPIIRTAITITIKTDFPSFLMLRLNNSAQAPDLTKLSFINNSRGFRVQMFTGP